MKRLAFAFALTFAMAPPASARSRCMGVVPVLCAFAKAHKLKIISGFRKGARIAGSRRKSLHASGRAMDVHGCKARCIRAARAQVFGLGFYRGAMHHIHISVGSPEAGLTFTRYVPRTRYAKRKHRRYARR